MKPKSKCCERYAVKAKACKDCPLLAGFSKKKRRKKTAELRKKLKQAA